MTISDFQKQKITALFKLYDSDDNGLLEEIDYDNYTAIVLRNRGEEADSKKGQTLKATMRKEFEAIIELTGKQEERKVSLDDYIKYYSSVIEKHDYEVLRQITEAIFDVIDANQDEFISETEYIIGLSGWRITTDDAKLAFSKMDFNHDGKITRDELISGARGYFMDTDVNSDHKYLFGGNF